MKYKSIYVAATSQHVGKTTSTLGLVSSFMKKGINVGYCKPVGQKHLVVSNHNVDKDTVLFADLIHFEIQPELHSPIILGSGATQKYLDTSDKDEIDLERFVLNAALHLSKKHDLVVYEGTGHPGVGSVANMSNAHVAKLLNAGVVMVVEGGIGSTIDMLNMTTALFREENVPIIGVIINKVIPSKIDKIRHYCSKWLDSKGIPLLGIVPYEKTLAYPVIKTIADAVKGPITFNADKAYNKVENIIAGSLIDLEELSSSEDLLLIVSTRSINNAISKIKSMTEIHGFEHCPLSGIVATGVGKIDSTTIEYIEENKLPLIRTDLDTYGCVIKISKIEVKINRNTPWKVKKAISLIEENVDTDLIMERLKVI